MDGKRPMKRRAVGGGEVTMFLWENYKDGFTTTKWERFDDIYRANNIFTKINFQHLNPKGS